MESAAASVDGNQRRGQTVDDVIGRLREAIFAGRIVPGQRLIANDLTENFRRKAIAQGWRTREILTIAESR